ncbi:MAG TPA: nickel-binding protein [Gammaproteobacteria bacterium]|jgi:class 3 adenylate cyclase
MPMYMDIHEMPGVTRDDLAKAHAADIKIQGQFGVEYHRYWLNEATGKVFCLCSAPDATTAEAVHREAHGAVARRIIEVTPDLAEAFLGEAATDGSGAAIIDSPKGAERDTGIRSVMFTDIVGSTDMTQRLGDEAAMEIVGVHDRIVRESLAALGGREVKHTGDGIMAAFLSAASAIRCGVQVQRGLKTHRESNRDQPLQVRIGVAAGEPVERNNDLFGSTVQLAARLCAHAAPEQIIVSNVVAELCIGKGVNFRDLGLITLKGFEQPARAHAVDW